jgi:hypothetical protein
VALQKFRILFEAGVFFIFLIILFYFSGDIENLQIFFPQKNLANLNEFKLERRKFPQISKSFVEKVTKFVEKQIMKICKGTLNILLMPFVQNRRHIYAYVKKSDLQAFFVES